MATKHLTARGLIAGLLLAAALPAAAQTTSGHMTASQAADTPQAMVVKGKFVMRDGEAIFKDVCAACHMPDAKGATGAGTYPALAGDGKLAAASLPVKIVLHGQKGMPSFGEFFDDDQVAAVVTYVRTHFGNTFARPVTATEVKAAR